jgi:polyisoprenoid-binding protein YceI
MEKARRSVDTLGGRGLASALMARQRQLLLGAAAAVILVAIVVTVGMAWLLRSHQAPQALALATTQPSGSVAALAGHWTVAAGSQVGYRVKEKFINQPAETEAVARTSKVTGRLVVAVRGTSVTVSQMTFIVDLASLTSQDRYANYQVYQRDFFVRTVYLQTDRFPDATFTADLVTFALPASGPATIDIPGRLMVHGITKQVTAHVQATGAGTTAEAAGSLSVDMRDFAIEPPSISFTTAEPQVTIEFDLQLTHA